MYFRYWLGTLLLGVAGVAPAQWASLQPEAAMISAVLADLHVPGRAYAFGLSGYFVTEDSGTSWTRAETGLPAGSLNGVRLVAADDQLPGRLYFFTSASRLARSSDFGKTWELTPFVPDANAGTVDSLIDEGGSADALYINMRLDVLTSADGGDSFFAWGSMQPPSMYGLSGLAIDPINPLRWVANSHNRYPGDLMISFPIWSGDGGVTWGGMNRSGVALSAEFHSDGFVYVSLDTLSFPRQSRLGYTDTGSQWTEGGSFTDLDFRVVELPNGEKMAYGATDCWLSSDRFLTHSSCTDAVFSSVSPDPQLRPATVAGPDGAVRLLLASKRSGVLIWDNTERAWSFSNSTMSGPLALNFTGVAVDAQQPQRMIASQTTPPLTEDSFAGLFFTHNGGASWAEMSLSRQVESVISLELDAAGAAYDDDVIYVVSGATISKISQQGLVTALTANWPSSVRAYRIALDPRSCATPPASGPCMQAPLQTVFALLEPQGSVSNTLLKMTGSGSTTWMPAVAGLPSPISTPEADEALWPQAMAFEPDGSAVYLATKPYYHNRLGTPVEEPSIASGVFRSIDGGSSWQAASDGLPERSKNGLIEDIIQIATHPRRVGRIWALAQSVEHGSRVYRSDDGADQWSETGASLGDCRVRELQVHKATPDLLYVAGVTAADAGCVLRSEDAGTTWTALPAPPRPVVALRLHPQEQGRLFVAGSGGIWMLNLPPEGIFADGLESH